MDVLTIGGKFGDYDVLALVGRGSMGAVYRIKDPKTGNEYACKVMFPEAAKRNPDYRKRFAREAAFAMSIKHPNLISVYDVGEDPETGLCYLIMDYVSGGTVEDRIARGGRFPIDEAVSVIARVAGALAVADKMHVVHRDIKPANIMFDADGTPKLADLGIARFNDGSATTTVTSAGMIVGTPAYMAPEQMTDSHSVDIRADIYSLGMVFFEMLTGERPNAGCSVVELLAKAIKGEGIPDVRTIRPEVSSSVAHILNLMCAPKPENRLSNPQQVVDMFWRLEHGQALIAKPPPQRSRKMTARRRKWMLTRVAVGLGGVAIFAIAYLLGSMGRGTGGGPSAEEGTNAVPESARAPAHPSLRDGLQFPDPATLLASGDAAGGSSATSHVAEASSGGTNAAVASAGHARASAKNSAAAAGAASAATNAAPAAAASATPAASTSAVASLSSVAIPARKAAVSAAPEVPREFPSVTVAKWDRKGRAPFDWLSAEPPKREVPLRVAWDFSHGFQLSCSQYTGFIFDNAFLGGGMPDGETCESRPVLFSLLHADLENADVLVLPTCYAGMAYTKDDLIAVRSFVENGGTALVFANEQNMLEQSALLKDYGIRLELSRDNSRQLKGVCPVLSKWRIENSYSYGEDAFVSAAAESKDVFPMVVSDDADRLSFMMMRRAGKGKVIFVSDRLFGRGQAGYVNTRWWRTLLTRCVRSGDVGGELKGETLEDAPIVSRAGHFVFYGAKSMDKMVASATRLAKLAVPAFEKYDLGLSPIKGGVSPSRLGASSTTDGAAASGGVGHPERVYVLAATGGSPGIHQSGSFEFLVSDTGIDPQYMLVPLLFPAGSAEYRNSPLGYNAYLLTLVLEDCGYRRQAQEARSAIAGDYKLGRTIAPYEELRTHYRGIFQRAAALARRDDVKTLIRDKPTEDDVVAILSMAAGRDLFPLFWQNGIEVSRVKSDIAIKFVEAAKAEEAKPEEAKVEGAKE